MIVQPFKVLVTGGRAYKNDRLVFQTLDDMHAHKPIDLLIHGDAPGADKIADRWALERGVQPVRCPANWIFYDNGAGPRRNRRMALLWPNVVVAFPGGKGTADMIAVAHAESIPVIPIDEVY